ncbi:MAG: methyltransferase [Novosphingobium sp.]
MPMQPLTGVVQSSDSAITVARAFGRAKNYDAHATVQRLVVRHLADRIVALALPASPRILEIGCGTGLLGTALIDLLPGARWLITDIAPEMVERTRERLGQYGHLSFAVMNGEAPDAVGRFDLICASLAFQWFENLAAAVKRLRALLKPGGRLMFTTLAEGSFYEWREAHAGLPSGIRPYPNLAALRAMGLEVIEADYIPIRYSSARAFLHELKGIGAGTARAGHRPLAPAQLKQVMTRFEQGGCKASHHVALCSARPCEAN